MDELIATLNSKWGLDASTAGAGVNKIMALLKENVGDDLFGQIASSVIGAGDAAAAGQASKAGGAFLKEKLGDEVTDPVLAKLPMLKTLLA